jgi:hypothetical protein
MLGLRALQCAAAAGGANGVVLDDGFHSPKNMSTENLAAVLNTPGKILYDFACLI